MASRVRAFSSALQRKALGKVKEAGLLHLKALNGGNWVEANDGKTLPVRSFSSALQREALGKIKEAGLLHSKALIGGNWVEANDGKTLPSGSRILFSSPSSGLVAEIDFDMLDAILKTKASTKTINAFGLDKSRMAKCLDGLFTGIDVSNLVFVFFPILLRGHWSLFVLYLNKDGIIPGLPDRKCYLLYFDSMELTDPFECMEEMERALVTLSKSASDPDVIHTLGSPSTQVTFERKQRFLVSQMRKTVDFM